MTWSPVQLRSLDFEVQPGVGFLPSLHLDGVSVIHHRTHPPGCRHERKIFLSIFRQNYFQVQEVKEYRANFTTRIKEPFYVT